MTQGPNDQPKPADAPKPAQKQGRRRRRGRRGNRRRRRRLLVVAAVIERADELLVSLRHPKGSRPSQWEFPGGKVEKGESERQALVREIREELGVRCTVHEQVKRVVYPYPDTDVEIAFYRTVIVEGEPQPLSMAEIRWVYKGDLDKLDFLVADRPFVAELVLSVRRDPSAA